MPRTVHPNPVVTTDTLLLNIGQSAGLIGISEHTLRRWSNKGQITARRIGPQGARRFKLADVLALRDSMIENILQDNA